MQYVGWIYTLARNTPNTKSCFFIVGCSTFWFLLFYVACLFAKCLFIACHFERKAYGVRHVFSEIHPNHRRLRYASREEEIPICFGLFMVAGVGNAN